MTARVGRGLTRPLHHAISPSRRNFPAFWRRVHSWDIRVVSTICNLSVGEERWAPIRGMRVPATAKFVPMCLPSPGKDGYCGTITCNSVIKQTLERRIEEGKYSRRRRSYLSKWRFSPGFSIGQELVDIERLSGVKKCNEL